MEAKKRKKQRIKICTIEDLNKALMVDESNLSPEELKILKDNLYEGKTTYKVDNLQDLMHYINNIKVFKEELNALWEEIKHIKELHIYRVEFERILTTQDDVEEILKIVEETKKAVTIKINDEGKEKIRLLEEEIDRDYVYAKDIELLKNILICKNDNVKADYDKSSETKSLYINIPESFSLDFIHGELGSVEYHKHIKSYIPRLKRLKKNLHKYIIKKDGVCKINQSSAIQDSVNIAIGVYSNQQFRAVSGKNDIENSCKLIPQGEETFKSLKVNKLGKLGIGYNRINDSEKKILERIDKLIKKGEIEDKGNLVLYSKWEPCPSCFYVCSQFCRVYPNIDLRIMYHKSYGEL